MYLEFSPALSPDFEDRCKVCIWSLVLLLALTLKTGITYVFVYPDEELIIYRDLLVKK